jgi:hypothetical protein
MGPSCRAKAPEKLWERIYEDPMAEVQDDYLSLMGQRPGWYVNFLEEIDREELSSPGCCVPGAPAATQGHVRPDAKFLWTQF